MKLLDVKSISDKSAFVKNKYVLASAIFLAWIGFIDENSLLDRFRLEEEFRKLNQDRLYYKSKIEQDSYEMEELEENKKLETIAREKYLMKKDDEELFIIQKK